MPRKTVPKQCACGCSSMTKGGDYLPGHDSKTLSAIIENVGGVKQLRQLVEGVLNRQIEVKL
jgi:hypothetical protein